VQTLETHYTTRAAVWLGLQLVDAGGSACLLLLWMGLYFPSVPNSAVMKEMRSEGHRGKDTPLLCHLYIKCIILPRQARDKQGKHSKKSGVSLGKLLLDCLFISIPLPLLGLALKECLRTFDDFGVSHFLFGREVHAPILNPAGII
jgi:hypothetical protein